MSALQRSYLLRYSSAAATVAAATLLRWLLDPLLGGSDPFTTYFIAVVATAWIGGLGPSLLAILLSSLSAAYFFIRPRGSFAVARVEDQTGMIVFLFVGIACALFSEALQRSRRRAEASAREAIDRQRELQVTLASIGDAVIATDIQGRVTFLNPVAEQLTGWPRAEAEGKPLEEVFRIVNEQTRQPIENPVAKVLREGAVVGLANHTVLIGQSGAERPIDDSAAPIRDEAGQVTGVVMVFRDVGEKRRAEQAVRANEERLRLAQEAARLGTWEWNILTNEVIWSPALAAIHGMAPGDFGGTFEAYQKDMHPEDRERVLASIAAAVREGKEHHLEYRLIWPDGSVHWIEARGKLFKDEAGRPVRMIGLCLDVDRRKRTEQAFRFLADASATLSTLVDYESTLQKVARLAVPYFADWCAVDMVEGGALRRLAVAHVDPAKVKFAHELEKKYPPDPNVPSGAHQVIRDGKSIWVPEITDAMVVQGARDAEHLRIIRELGLRSFMCVPLKARGRALGVISFVAAESGRHYDAADLQFAEELARRAAIAIENAQLYAQLRQADRRKDEFLAVLAHELRNPLAPIRNAVGVMALREVDDPQLRWARDVIERQAAQMTRLVDDLLDISRISRGKVELRPEPIDLIEIVKRAIETVRPLVEERRHELTVALPAEPLPLSADPTRIEQVLANLLNNAAKYTPDGGRIQLGAEREGDEAVVRVTDNGIGVEAAFLPQLFEMFAQAEPGRMRAEGGLGIGLSLVRSLVERHGGTVAAASDGRGKGCTFTLRLPLLDVDGGASRVVRDESDASLRNSHHAFRTPRRVLVVDDNADAADSLAMVLQMEGHHVEVAHDGAAAIRRFGREPAEVVFLDVGMPEMDGLEVARRLRQLPGGRGALLVAITGWGQEEDRRLSREAGFDHHLTKPVEIGAIHELLAIRDGV